MTGQPGELAQRPGEVTARSGEVVPRPAEAAASPPPVSHRHQLALLDRVLACGVVVTGEVRLAIADVDLVTISLQALVSSVRTVAGEAEPPGGGQAGDW